MDSICIFSSLSGKRKYLCCCRLDGSKQRSTGALHRICSNPIKAKKKTLSQLCEGFTVYPQILKNVRVADKAVAQADPDVQAAVAEVAAKLGDSGRILVRESGTEPVVRVMVEAQSKEIREEYVDFVIDAIRRKGHCV